MRILLAMLAIAALTETAVAQGAVGGRKGHGSRPDAQQQQSDQQKKKAVDDAYKSAINRIPDPKEKYDPWKTAR